MVSEPDFPKSMLSHEPALVNVCVHAVYPALASVLPHGDVTSVRKRRFTLCVLSYHDFIAVKLALHEAVIEVGERVKQGLLLVGFLYKDKKLM